MESDNQGRTQHEFNNAVGYIQRLDKIFYMIAQSKLDNNTRTYSNCLKLLFHELSGEMTKEEVKKFKERLRELREELDNQGRTRNSVPQQTHYDLEDMEIELRQVYRQSGLQSKAKEDFFSSDDEW